MKKEKEGEEEKNFKVERSERNLGKRDYTSHTLTTDSTQRREINKIAQVEETRANSLIFRNKFRTLFTLRQATNLTQFKPLLAEDIALDRGSSRLRQNGHGEPTWARPVKRERETRRGISLSSLEK